jgi:DNA ligase D-like protein (predicted ligase)
MLPVSVAEPFDSPSHFYEVLWDGIRCLAFVERGATRLQDRYGRDVTWQYPELQSIGGQLHGSGLVLDGEIVALDERGRPEFGRLEQRLRATDESEAERLAARVPVTYQAFDILYREGLSLEKEPLRRRKAVLRQAVRMHGPLEAPDHVEREGVAFFEAVREHGLEGIIAKDRESPYLAGRRSPAWSVVRVFQRDEFVIGGYTYGGPLRRPPPRAAKPPFASLLLGLFDAEGALRYAGEVTGGFEGQAEELAAALEAVTAGRPPFADPPALPRLVFWCRPELAATIRFSQWAGGRLRFPLFERLRPDVPAEACRFEPVETRG